MFEETSVSDDRQDVFAESSDEDVGISSCTDDNSSQGQQDEVGTSTNFLAVRKGSHVRITDCYFKNKYVKFHTNAVTVATTFELPEAVQTEVNSDNRHAVCPTKSYATNVPTKE